MERLNFQAIEKKWQSSFDKEKLYTNNRYEIVVFARYMLIIILSTIFEDKGAYIVLWILIFIRKGFLNY